MSRRKMPTYRDFVEKRYLPFVETYKSTWRTDDAILRTHILPAFGHVRINRISSDLIAVNVIGSMRNRGYACGTINRAIAILRYSLNLARKWKVLVGDNPAAGLSAGPDVLRTRVLNKEEVTRLICALSADDNRGAAVAILLLLLTGARRNEITHARWEQVDWNRRILNVPSGKSRQGRIIPLSETAVSVLRGWEHNAESAFIFPSSVTGCPPASLFFPWNRIRRRAGLKEVRLHDLRHSFASFLVNKGVSLYIVQHLLGHTHPRTTQRYAHLETETLCNAAELMASIARADTILRESHFSFLSGSLLRASRSGVERVGSRSSR